MALIKEKMTPYGILASYWKVSMLTIDRSRKEASIVISLYATKDSEESIEQKCVAGLMLEQTKEKYEQYFGIGTTNYTDIYNACYEYAKENDEYFMDAVSDNI